MSRTEGFTLVEIMIAISIMAILLAIAVPSFREAGLGSELRSLSTELIASAHLARSEAMKRGAPVTLCVSPGGDACTAGAWRDGWIVTDGAAALRVQGAAPQGFRVREASALTAIVFQATGVGATPATFTVCRATPQPGHQEREVTINAAGRAESRRTTVGVCP
jgi:type IV fimbrial biogenesis protein FimT